MLALGDVLDGQEDDSFFSQCSFNLPGIQKHYSPSDGGKFVLNLIVVKRHLLGKDGFQQFPQFGDIPLFVSKVIDKLSHGFFRGYLEEVVEGTANFDYS